MIEQPAKEEVLSIIKEIEANPAATQRAVSDKLGISLGKTNYLLKELVKKGLIEVGNFTNRPGKFKKICYHLSKAGLEYRISATQHFLKEKKAEYDQIKEEWEKLNAKVKAGSE